MSQYKIEHIIAKFLNNEANIQELEQLEKKLQSPENLQRFNRFVKIEYLTSLSMGTYNKTRAQIEINKKIKAIKKQKRMLAIKKLSIAASIIIALGFGYLYFNNTQTTKQNIVNTPLPKPIKPGTDKAILTLANGNQVSLEKGENYTNDYVESDGKKLTYKQQNSKKTIEYNYLDIPRGGEYFVILADGTKVWLNSESKLKYPTTFIKGNDRNVELIYGEAYFVVSPSTKHQGAPFNVHSKGQKVNVIGTEFNIKAYSDETKISTTLVEGKIAIEKEHIKRILKPSQQAQIDLNKNTINVLEVDTFQETAWVKGLFSFEEARLDRMMKTLSRWYNTEVIFENSSHRDFEFTGILERTNNIEEILEIIEKTSQDDKIKFDIKNNIILIK